MKNETDALYATVHRVLSMGVVASNTLFVVGVALTLLGPVGERGHPWLVAGTALLVVTPVSRIVVSLVVFLRAGDRKFVAVTTAVIVVLAVTVVLSLRRC